MQHDFFQNLDRLRCKELVGISQDQFNPNGHASFPKTRRVNGEFLKGPIPLDWLSRACSMNGKSPLLVALAILFEVGRRKSCQIKLTTAICQRFGINRKSKYRGLSALEKENLISVDRRLRRNPIVTVLDTKIAGSQPSSINFTKTKENNMENESQQMSVTWEQLVELEPRLSNLLNQVVSARPEGEEDFNYEICWGRFKQPLADLVGFHRKTGHDNLRTSESYQVAYDKLWHALHDEYWSRNTKLAGSIRPAVFLRYEVVITEVKRWHEAQKRTVDVTLSE